MLNKMAIGLIAKVTFERGEGVNYPSDSQGKRVPGVGNRTES